MGIFDKIRNAIFGSAQVGEIPNAVTASATPAAPAAPTPAAATAALDVSAMIENAAKAKGQKLNWKTSVIDLMKTLDLDSSLNARKALAKKLNCPGETAVNSAKMNAWLHKALMQKLAENDGKLPDGLKN